MDRLTAAQKYELVINTYIPPCPWNPFPANSDWGREIERRYTLNELKRRRRAALEVSNG